MKISPIFALALIAVTVSGCLTYSHRTKDGVYVYDEKVKLSGITIERDEAKKRRPPIKVSSIQIDGTGNGEVLAQLGVKRTTTYHGASLGSTRHGAVYRLDGDAPSIVRSSLSNVIEFDEKSPIKAKVNYTISIIGSLDRNWWCKFWNTSSQMYIEISLREGDRKVLEKDYLGRVEDDFCATAFLFPSGDSFSNLITKAVKTALREMVEDRENWQLSPST